MGMSGVPKDREFWADVLNRIVQRTRNACDAEDLLHSAYVRLERYRARRPVANPAAFLVQTAINIQIDNYRHAKRFYGEMPASIPDCDDLAARADDIIVAKERLSQIVSDINRLPSRTREIFLMHRIDKLEYSQIARKLNISKSAVEKQMAKAMAFLADQAKVW